MSILPSEVTLKRELFWWDRFFTPTGVDPTSPHCGHPRRALLLALSWHPNGPPCGSVPGRLWQSTSESPHSWFTQWLLSLTDNSLDFDYFTESSFTTNTAPTPTYICRWPGDTPLPTGIGPSHGGHSTQTVTSMIMPQKPKKGKCTASLIFQKKKIIIDL